MDQFFIRFKEAYLAGNGNRLSEILLPLFASKHRSIIHRFYNASNASSVKADIQYNIFNGPLSVLRLSTEEGKAWVDIFVAYWTATGELISAEHIEQAQQASWAPAYEAWKELSNAIIRGYTNGAFQAWTLPCLYVAGKHLRIVAIKADAALANVQSTSINFNDEVNPEAGKNQTLEDAARVLNRMFQLCFSDRESLELSRKWGTYYIANLLFKTYFKLNSVTLSKNIIRALQASRTEMPSIDAFPKAHQVTFNYYMGVIAFLEEDYKQAESYLTKAWEMCLKNARSNQELILTYLIPCHLITTHTLPTKALLAPFPRLQKLFLPLSRCVKQGDLAGFDKALMAGEDEFVRRRIYLTLERGRDIALRNLMRKVFIAGGFEAEKDKDGKPIRRTRVPVAEFRAAISMGSKESLDNDEVECLLANIIYKNLMKGYIARERGIVVLSKTGAFPGTGI